MDNPTNNSWNEWSVHVLKELSRLGTGLEALREQYEGIKVKLSDNQIASTVIELKEWKKEVDDIASPRQLKEQLDHLKDKSEKQEKFRIQAMTVFAVVNAITYVLMGLAKFLG